MSDDSATGDSEGVDDGGDGIDRKADADADADADRRRHSRFPVGLPVRVHLSGRQDPIIVELMDLSVGGGRFRASGDEVALDQRAAFGFIVPEERRCLARGRIIRLGGAGEFAVSLDKANEAFIGFLDSLDDLAG